MIQLIILTLLAALLVLYTFFPAAWRALMARDIEAYPYYSSSHARFGAYSRYGGYNGNGHDRGLMGVAMRHPFRASGPPACMAKLIMQRHKIHQSIARTNKSKKSPSPSARLPSSPSSAPTRLRQPVPLHAEVQVPRPQIRVRIPSMPTLPAMPSMPTIRVPPPPTAPRLPMDPVSSVDVGTVKGDVVGRPTPPTPAPVLVPPPVHELSHPQPSLSPSSSSLSPPSSTPLALPLSSPIPLPLPLSAPLLSAHSSLIPEHSNAHAHSPASTSLPPEPLPHSARSPSEHLSEREHSAPDSPRHTQLYPSSHAHATTLASHAHSHLSHATTPSASEAIPDASASPADMLTRAHACPVDANYTPVLPAPFSTSPSIRTLLDTPINNARRSPRSFVDPLPPSDPSIRSHEPTHRARDTIGVLYPHDGKSRPYVYTRAHDEKHGYDLRLHGAPSMNMNSMGTNSWLTTSLSSLSLSIPIPSSPSPKDYALNVLRIKFTFTGAEKPFVFPFAPFSQGLGRRASSPVVRSIGRVNGRNSGRRRGRVLVVGKQYH
ncbi:hypothetical protein BDN71DRAFT_1447140 [Pleurotus eryngii]|uniref:Uncharacterized protein n=1 Tax=Pleurotus eryngii TaxID=5323 RepID=A0A9P6D8X7_PLEER|nr:hypothetical protein BDN71DRAFT_1447140 [Pleurotus eryngii]